MINFGNIPAGSVLPVIFATYGKTNGESITLTGLAVTDIEIYKGTSMTQRSSDAGYTLLDTDGIDIDGVTGIHGFSIDTGDNTDSGFYAAGSFYTVVVSAVTIDGQTVNFIAATFRIVAAENTAGVPVADTVRVAGTAQTAKDIGAAVPAAAAGASGGLVINGSNSGTVTLAALTISGAVSFGSTWGVTGAITWSSTWSINGTSIDVAAGNISANVVQWNGTNVASPATAGYPVVTIKVGTGTGEINLSSGNVPATVAGAVGSVTGNVGGNVTGSVGSVVGAVGSVTGNVGGNVTGSVGSIASGGITSGSFAADSITASAIAADAIGASELAAGAATEIATAIGALAVDTGLTYTKVLEMMAAFMAGVVTKSSAAGVTTYSWKKRDGATASFTSACSETDGTRSNTGSAP